RDGQRRRRIVVGPAPHRILLEWRTAGTTARRSAEANRRIDRAVQRTGPPAVPRHVADGWQHEEIASARRRDVRDAHALGLVAADLTRLVEGQLDRRPAAKPE